jgi:hypothetical protein
MGLKASTRNVTITERQQWSLTETKHKITPIIHILLEWNLIENLQENRCTRLYRARKKNKGRSTFRFRCNINYKHNHI